MKLKNQYLKEWQLKSKEMDDKTNLSALNSSEPLNQYGFAGFTWQTYCSLVICLFGVLTNLINISVFSNSKLKDPSYSYLLAKSLIDFIYLSLAFVNQIVNYCFECAWSQTYWANLYGLAIGVYLMPCLVIFRLLIENIVSVYIYLILSNRVRLINRVSYKLAIFLSFTFSVLFYAQRPFSVYIASNDDHLVYFYKYTDFGLSRAYRVISIIQSLVRISLAVILLTIVNILNSIRFNKRFKSGVIRAVFIPKHSKIIFTPYYY